MDAFEHVVASILQKQGYWTLTSVKVNITRAEKIEINRRSSPRWELDIVAYSGSKNHVLVVECKSFLDSSGVDPRAFDGTRPRDEKRYKLFCDDTLRQVVLKRLEKELVDAGFCRKNPEMTLCLAAGKVHGDVTALDSEFKKRGWKLIGPEEIRMELEALAATGYENSVVAVVAKMLVRERTRKRAAKPNLVADA